MEYDRAYKKHAEEINALHEADVLEYGNAYPGIISKNTKRLTLHHCRNQITVIDNIVHLHSQCVEAANDVQSNIGKKREIAIIGAAKAKGMKRSNIYHFTVKEVLNELLEKFVRRDEAILIKGASKPNMFIL